ncbi:putative IgW heavy chain V region W26 protein [Naja naja]|nr:putative IgW heavy chain V region W26 protein [Naja naja]
MALSALVGAQVDVEELAAVDSWNAPSLDCWHCLAWKQWLAGLTLATNVGLLDVGQVGSNSRCKSHSFFTMTPHFLILIMLVAFCKSGLSQVVLTQSDSVLKKPGKAHKLTCAVTGFTVNSYNMDWIRHKPGQGLEWLVLYYTSSSNYYSLTIQGWFTASKDSSNFYLQMNNLKADDTAVYYCARDTSPGKELEFVASVSQPQGTKQWYNSKVEGRFIITRDNSQTSAYLQMNNLKPEDSALYYCAREHNESICFPPCTITPGVP